MVHTSDSGFRSSSSRSRDKALRHPAVPRSLVSRLLALCLLVPFLATGCAWIEEPPQLDEGFTLGVLAGGVAEDFDLPSGIESESAVTYGLRAGYRVHPHWAVEVSAENLSEQDVRRRSRRMDVGDVDLAAFVLQLKAYTNDDALQGYGLVGIGLLDADVEDSSTGTSRNDTEALYRFGAGLETHSGAHWSFYAEGSYNLPEGWADDFRFFSIIGGMTYRF